MAGTLIITVSGVNDWTVNWSMETVPFDVQFSWIGQPEENPNGNGTGLDWPDPHERLHLVGWWAKIEGRMHKEKNSIFLVVVVIRNEIWFS